MSAPAGPAPPAGLPPVAVPRPRPPAELGPLLAQVRALAGDPDRFTAAGPDRRAGWLVGLLQLRDTVDAAVLTALAAFDTAGDAAALQATSTATWLRGHAKLTPADATERVAIARATRDTTLTAPHAALTAAAICYDQLRAIHHAVRALPHAAQPQAVALLTDLAEHTDTPTVRTAGRHLRHVVDPDGALTAAEHDYTRRHLTLSPLLDGMTALSGLLDPEAATWLTTALAPALTPTGPHDTRTPAQRRADGLIDLLRTALATPTTRTPVLPHLHVLIPLHALPDGDQPQPPGPAGPDPLAGLSGLATLPDCPTGAHPLTPPALQRLSCDATLARVLLGPASEILDLGRTTRLFTPAQHRALALRDRGCRFPDCPRPPHHTDAHHIRHWTHGGETTLPNGVLLCRHHHRATHEGGWTITPENPTHGANTRLWFTGPHHQHLPSDPRGP